MPVARKKNNREVAPVGNKFCGTYIAFVGLSH